MSHQPIAVVGTGCAVPGALDPGTFWANIAAGRCELTPGEGGRVRGFDASFDAGGFAIDADDIMALDPLLRWVLHAGRQALHEAGHGSRPLPGAGLVLGNLSYPSTGLTRFAEQIWRAGQPSTTTDPRDRFSSGLPAHLAARALRLGRGGFALDAACASALYAVRLGCDRLRAADADLMLAGAVSRPDRLLITDGFRALSAASPTGSSRPFHRGADGLVPGEGAVLVALMRLADAIASGAPVLGVIRAVGLSNDGRAGGLLAPAEEGQRRAMRLAYAEAGVAARTVSLVECHATGTPVGDAVEARSMARVFAGCRDLPVGSVKSNVGHLLTAAGGAGLLKVLAAMRAGVRPASLCADDPIEALDGTPLRLLAAAEDWPGPRRAAVSAFGFGGANAHLIVDAWDGDPPAAMPTPRRGEPVAITSIGAKVADGADTGDFRRAVLLGQARAGPRTAIDVALDGLRFPPRDLESAHAQQVLLLEAAREAAGGRSLPRERTAVIVGMGVDPEVARYPVTQRVDDGQPTTLAAAGVLGTMPNLVANRVNVQLDVAGPSYTVSAEEASGLVAVELAGRALRAGEVDVAVVGAVDLSVEPVHQAAVRALGRDRRPGDAAVVLILERLSDARRAGRRVIAVLDDPRTPPSEPDLLVGDGGADGPGSPFRLDPAELFGTAHAAYGLVAVATAATAVSHRAFPRPGEPAEPGSGDVLARVVVQPLEGAPASVTLRAGDPPAPWIAGPAPQLRVYSGAGRAEVIAALDAGRESGAGPARLAVIGDVHGAPVDRAAAARRWLTDGGPQPDGVAYRDAPVAGEVAFVFTNGSAAYPGMGAELALAFPDFARAVGYGRAPGLGRLAPPPGVLDQIWEAARLSAFHADVTRGPLGLRPAAAIGYSSGESAALAALGAWPDRAGLLRDLRASDLFSTGLTGEFRVVREAWRQLGRPATRWVSYVVGAPADVVREALHGAPAVHLMAVNEPGSCVIGGEETSCAAVLRRLGTAPVFPLDYQIAAHAPELAAVRDEYRALHLRPTRDVPGVRFYSGATGEAYRATAQRAADAILAQALGTVDFVQLIQKAWADGVRVFVEHGPQAQCTGWIRRILAGRDHLAVALDAPGGRAVHQLCQAVAELVAAGVPVEAHAFLGRLAGAADHRAPDTATVRLPAHPPELRLPDRGRPTVMVRAPRLPPVLAAAGPPPPDRSAPAADGVSRLVADQFARATKLHLDFLAQQAETHARFLDTRSRTLNGLARLARSPRPPVSRGPAFTRAELERLAADRISEHFGPRFAALDGRTRLTRLPAPPMLLVDRVTGIDAEPDSMGTGTIWTETDVTPDAWYLDATGRMPAGLMVEAGQADLLLISWLGVDLRHPGDRVYRLLGCELTYRAGAAVTGETLRYDIHVDRHAEHDGIRLFFFHYDCRVGDQLRMTVRDGQAGFFTDAELASTEGLPWNPAQAPPTGPPPARPVAVPDRRHFGPARLRAFAEGRPADCFGPAWTVTRAHLRSPRIGGASGRMLLLGAVTDLDPAGGAWHRGYLRAETAVTPDDWFFAGHFTNDPCMPGTLMFEGGLQAMAFYLAALGHTIDRDGWRFEPVPDEPCLLRCRGQVTPDSRRIEYEVFVRHLSADPYPTLYADVLGTVDGVRAFHAQHAALRLVPDWPLDADGESPDGDVALAGGVRQDYTALLACASGRLSRAMGSGYARFDDGGRRAPRLPGPPYHFMSRIVCVDGEFGGMRPGATVTAEYDVPADAWYFAQNGAATMPFAVLMEIALQPCGWLAMYLGSVLRSEVDLLFRNLDGTGLVRHEVLPGTRVLRTRVECREISRFDSTTIESFTVRCTAGGGPVDGGSVFEMDTVFGFFPREAFANQPGLPPSDADRSRLALPGNRTVNLRDRSAHLPGPMLIMLDRVTACRPDGGSHGLGWLRAEKDIDANDWYFKAHFFQDPVQPGSLGVQAMCNLLQWYLIDRGTPAGATSPRFEPIATGQPVTWKYRGQVTPTDRRVTVELDVTAIGADQRGRYAIADGWLWVDNRRIYQVTGLGMRMLPGG
ncbi:MAG: hypothetical protein V7603_290 [Micromonosporaceae bacterium]